MSTGYGDRPVARAIKIKHAGLNLTGQIIFSALRRRASASSRAGEGGRVGPKGSSIGWKKIKKDLTGAGRLVVWDFKRKDNMKKITIVWGTDKEDKKTYEFKTDEQLKYFMMGVDEANGWLEYEIEEN